MEFGIRHKKKLVAEYSPVGVPEALKCNTAQDITAALIDGVTGFKRRIARSCRLAGPPPPFVSMDGEFSKGILNP